MRTYASAVGLVLAVLLMPLTVAAQRGPDVEAKADQHLKAMSSYLAGLKSFTVQVEESFDVVQEDGQKLQFSNERKISVRRPNKVHGESNGDTAHSRFYYDGKTVTVFDPLNKTYATEKVSDTIDKMLDELHERYGIDQPLADFLFADPYKVLMEYVREGSYVGLNRVGKQKCHHLAFQQRLLDWQIWIEAGKQPLPRKLVITFKRQAGEPQYQAILHHWEINPELAEAVFHFEPPVGVHRVDFLHRHGDTGPVKKPPRH
jgi:hypothetical protein